MTLEKPGAAVPAHLRNLRTRVLKELCRRVRRLDESGRCPFDSDLRSMAYLLEALDDTFSFEDSLNLPGAPDPLILAEVINLPDKSYVLALQRVEWRVAPVWAELASEFRPL